MEIGWYNKDFFLLECWEDKKIFVIFDGVYGASDVWINYAYPGYHESGYTSFVYDLTDYVRFADTIPNGLRVRVDGRRHEEDMYEGNGIYRHVWLLVTNKLYMPYWGIMITTPNVTKEQATVEIKTKIQNDKNEAKQCSLCTIIAAKNGHQVAEGFSKQTIPARSSIEIVQKTIIKNPILWTLDNPYLYKAHSLVSEKKEVVDTEQTTFGVRTFRFDADQGFFLNGEPVKLKGFNAHYDFAGLGTALPIVFIGI